MGEKEEEKKEAGEGEKNKREEKGEKEEPKKEEGEKKEVDGEKKAEDENPEMVLKVDMHCEGCARKVQRALRGFPVLHPFLEWRRAVWFHTDTVLIDPLIKWSYGGAPPTHRR